MTAFIVNSGATVTTAQTLTLLETGVVGPGGLLAVSVGTAVTLSSGTPYLAVLGTILGTSGPRAVGNDGVTISSNPTISVGASGTIMAPVGTAIGLTFSGTTLNISSDGNVTGNQAVRLNGTATVGQSAFVDNNGIMSANGFAIVGETALENLFVTNTGTIQATNGRTIQLQSTFSLGVYNTGTIASTSTAIESFGSLDVRNTGTVLGNMQFQTTAFIRNSGLIQGTISDANLSSTTGAGTATVENGGTITGNVVLGNGNDFFRDLGGTVGGKVDGGAGDDTYFVRSTDLRIIDTSGDADRIWTTVDYRITAGIEALIADTSQGLQLTGSSRGEAISGNTGSDTIYGGRGNDTLWGASGEDFLYGGLGDDALSSGFFDDPEDAQIFGGDGNDSLTWFGGAGSFTGGAGTDTFLVTVDGTDLGIDLAAGTASLIVPGGTTLSSALVSQFENVTGGNGNDTISGTNGANVLLGGNGNDSLLGLNGNDVLMGEGENDTLRGGGNNDAVDGGSGSDSLFGDAGNDTLTGGDGKDILYGGGGVDVFDFNTVAESAAGSQADVILGFDIGFEQVDLSTIDADPGLGGDQAFAFIGAAAFGGTTAQVRFVQSTVTGQTIVEVRQAGDTITDMEIVLDGLLTLTATNFIL